MAYRIWDWTGHTLAGFKVLGRARGTILGKRQRTEWWCRCLACHRVVRRTGQHFTVKGRSGCGCRLSSGRLEFRFGQKINRLTVLGLDHRRYNRNYFWRCWCDCGKPCVVSASLLHRGKVLSCGCAIHDPDVPFERKCRLCKHPFQTAYVRQHFCSTTCCLRYNGGYRGPSEKECKNCKKQFIAARPSQIFCNPACRVKLRSSAKRRLRVTRKIMQRSIQLNQLYQETANGQ